MCSCVVAIESQVKEALAVFLVNLHLLQLPIALNIIHAHAMRLHVSVLGSCSNFMHLRYVHRLASGMLYD